MRSGRSRRYRRRHQKKNYIYILIAAVAVIMIGAAGATLAWLSHQSGLTNQFELGEVSAKVDETFNGSTKSDVKVTNTGSVPAYIRASIEIYWQDENGDTLWGEPKEGMDYSIQMNLPSSETDGGQWLLGADGFYYYTKPVEPDQATAILIKECKELGADSHEQDGKSLVVDIAAQSIQAQPEDAVLDAWETVTEVGDGGVLTITEGNQNAEGGGDTP